MKMVLVYNANIRITSAGQGVQKEKRCFLDNCESDALQGRILMRLT